MTRTIQINESNFAREVLRASQPVLVEFWSDWRQLSLAMKEVAEECSATFKMAAINLDENPRLRSQLRINFLPTVLFFVNGAVRGRAVGGVSKAVIRSTIKARSLPLGEATLSLTTPITAGETAELSARRSRNFTRRAIAWMRNFVARLIRNFRAPLLMPDSFGLLPWRFNFPNSNL